MDGRFWRGLAAVVLLSLALESLQHYLMDVSSMNLYHLVSALLTLSLVGLVAWQMNFRLRWREAQARAEQLEAGNRDLRAAVQQLARSDRLAATGAAVVPLSESLDALLAELPTRQVEPAVLQRLETLAADVRGLTDSIRATMRPVDLANLVAWLVDDLLLRHAVRLDLVRSPAAVWVKANPARLELALRHFLTHATDSRPEAVLVVVVDAQEGCATVVIAGETDAATLEQEGVHWQIAQTAITECGGSVTTSREADGLVQTLYLPLGPAPSGPNPRPRTAPAAPLLTTA